MALTPFLFSSALILSLLVVASSAENGYSPSLQNPKPEYERGPKPTSDGYSPNPTHDSTKSVYGPGPKPKSLDVELKSGLDADYVPKPELDIPKKPSSEYTTKYDLETPKKACDVYSPKPEPETPKKPTDEYVPKPESNIPKTPSDVYVPKPELETPKKPSNVYVPKPEPETPKKSTDVYVPKPEVETPKTLADHYIPKPETPLVIGVEGLVLCKSGSKYIPIKGAVARITCLISGHNGVEATPFSCLTSPTDEKGFFFKTLADLGVEKMLMVRECNVKLEKSPSENCNIPTNVNKGITGAVLSSYQILHDRKIKLYPVGPFFYTSYSQPQSTPSPNAY